MKYIDIIIKVDVCFLAYLLSIIVEDDDLVYREYIV